MIGLFKRIARLFKSNMNHLISKAEDPEKVLEQVLLDMRQQLRQAQQKVANAIADERKMKKDADESSKKADSWEQKAMKAIAIGKDDLAKEALRRKVIHDELSNELDEQWQLQKRAVEQLKEALHQLNEKINEASRKKNLLIARKKRAEAQKMIQDTVSGIMDHSAFDTLERMTHRVDALEAESEAQFDINLELQEQPLERQFRQLEAGGQPEDQALAALKAKMGILPNERKELVAETRRDRENIALEREEEW